MRAVGAALAAVILVAFAQPTVAETLTANSDAVYEGHELTIKFRTASPTSYRMRYKYKTADGTATGSGWFKDYEPTSGYVYWAPQAYDAEAAVTVETKQDQLCEHDETVKIVLTEPKFHHGSVGWIGSCAGVSWLPCRFEAVATIKQHEQGCNAGQFGE